MSHDYAELTRRATEAWNRDDLAGWLEGFDEEVEWVPYMAALEAPVYRGHEGVTRVWEDIKEDMEALRVELREFIPIKEDLFVLVLDFHGAGRRSGVPIDQSIAQVHRVRNGKAVHVHGFGSKEAALAAAREIERGSDAS